MRTQHELSRRRFVTTLATGSLVVGLDPAARSWVLAADGARGPFERVPPLDGTLSLDEATRRAYSADYGRVIREEPAAVLRPGSVADIARMVTFARRAGLRIAARGAGHQPFGQAQVRGGLVIDMRSLHAVGPISADRVEVEAGADWRTVVQATLRQGLTPPVLTAYLGLTVGGTLSIGGVGTTTFRHGAQVDQVHELEVVTGEGQILRCSDMRQRDLFEAALAGQGQCAVITRAVLRLVRAPRLVREYVLPYADLPALLRDGARMTEDGRFDGVAAMIAPAGGRWTYALAATRHLSAAGRPDDAALTAGLGHRAGAERVRDLGYLQSVEEVPRLELGPSRPDLGLHVPASAAGSYVDTTLPRLTGDDLGPVLGIRAFFWKQGPFARPLFRLPREATMLYLVTVRTPTTDAGLVARMLAGNRALFERNRDLGGTLYPFSAVELTPLEWQQHYGAAWPALAQAKRRYDPDSVFASGPDIFPVAPRARLAREPAQA